MADQTDADDGRTDTKRFSDDVDASDLIEGDRIAPKLVARDTMQLGKPLYRQSSPDEPDEPDTQLVQVTATRDMDDTHTAILLDPETDTFIRAGRHDSQAAWSQKEADWKVRDIGSEVVVDEVTDLERPKDEQDDDAERYAQEWVSTIFDEIRYTGGDDDFHDERRVEGTGLHLRDYDGRELWANISLE